MALFKDQFGREWSVVIDTWQLRVVRERCDFEIGKMLEDKMRRWDELADPVRLGSILFALVADQARERGVSEEQFHRGLAGDAIQHAYEAFERAYLDFCPSRQRELLTAAARKSEEIQTASAKLALDQLAKVDPVTAARAMSNVSAIDSPASSDAIPAG